MHHVDGITRGLKQPSNLCTRSTTHVLGVATSPWPAYRWQDDCSTAVIKLKVNAGREEEDHTSNTAIGIAYRCVFGDTEPEYMIIPIEHVNTPLFRVFMGWVLVDYQEP